MDRALRLPNGDIADLSYMRYPGWSQGNLVNYPDRDDPNKTALDAFFSENTIKFISDKITQLTLGVDPKNRPIVVPYERITEVMNSVFWNYKPSVGDIYSREILPSDEQQNMIERMISQTIEIITNNIRNELGMIQSNLKLSAWVQVYGDFNVHQLRSHPIIKTLENRPATMQFNMNY